MDLAIETEALKRVFQERRRGRVVKEQVALRGIDLAVKPGECFGLLGANGAGKTTLIKILCTLLLPSGGEARVLGLDVRRDAAAIRRRINMVSGGEHSGYGILTVRESLWMFSQLYDVPNKEAFRRIDHLLEMVDLDGSVRVNKLSTGMRQKMNFARGFLSEPDVLFLDEPTLGLDVQTAHRLRAFVRDWVREQGRTVLLTTHYMAEADEICDRVSIISDGTILACETPAALKRDLQRDTVVRVEVAAPAGSLDLQAHSGLESSLRAALEGLPGVHRASPDAKDGRIVLRAHLDSDAALTGLLAALAEQGYSLQALQKEEPTLEDVFLTLTGRRLDDAAS